MRDHAGPGVSLLRSASFRLALLQAAIFAVIVTALFGITTWTAGAFIERRVHEIATDGLGKITQVLNANPSAPAGVYARELDENQHYGLFDRSGNFLDGEITQPEARDRNIRTTLAGSGGQVVHLHVTSGRLADGRLVVAGMNRTNADMLLGRLRRAFFLGGAAGIAAALIAGFVTSRRYLRRVERIASIAGQIDDGRLDTRLPVTDRRDEIDLLSAALNANWQRTESLVEGMRQLSTDVAHELRTPLSHLRLRLERTRAELEPESPARGAVEKCLNDVDHVLAVFRALLRISQIQARQRRAGFETVDVSRIVRTVVGDFMPLFEDEGRVLHVDIQDGVLTTGDSTLLEQVLVNLIENALRHTPKGTPVTVRLRQTDESTEMSVSDAGAGIPESQRERVLQRLVRLDAARSSPGMGLGLALVKAIADLHEAALELADAQPGLRVTLRLPPGS